MSDNIEDDTNLKYLSMVHDILSKADTLIDIHTEAYGAAKALFGDSDIPELQQTSQLYLDTAMVLTQMKMLLELHTEFLALVEEDIDKIIAKLPKKDS